MQVDHNSSRDASRLLSPVTREDETSNIPTSHSLQSASPRLESEQSSLEEASKNKPATQHRRSQSIATGEADHSSSTAAVSHHWEASTPLRPGAKHFVPKSEQSQRPTSSPSSSQATALQRSQNPASYFVRQPRAFGLDARSPSVRRAPASRSSHGIETLSGPPPALITQRSYTGEGSWKYTQQMESKESAHQRASERLNIETRDTQIPEAINGLDIIGLDDPTRPKNMRLAQEARSGVATENNQDQDTLRGSDFPQTDRTKIDTQTSNGQIEKRSQSSHEDLFLNLARADSAVHGDAARSPQKQRRRSRASLSGAQPPLSYQPSTFRQSDLNGRAIPRQRPSSNRDQASPSWQGAFAAHQESPDPGIDKDNRERPYTSSAYPLDQRSRVSHSRLAPRASLNASRARRPSTRGPSPDLPGFGSGRLYEAGFSADPLTPSFRQPNGLHTTPDQYNSSPLTGYSLLSHRQVARRSSRADGTESTISTNAPSMILEQLDDLNSRIKKLELNGKMPSTSSAAMSSVLGEPPVTAATTMTTLSASPKHGHGGSISPDAPPLKDPVNHKIRPLLHSALARCKDTTSGEIFHALEATTSDALALAAMAGSAEAESNGDAAVSTSNAIEQRLRHRANSMCRSLTELCIALSDMKSDAQSSSAKSPPGSVDTSTTVQLNTSLAVGKARSSRATSVEPELRTSSRVMSRLEARRSSQIALNAQVGRREPSPFESPGLTPNVYSSTTSRTPSALLKRRAEDDELPNARTWAITEIAQPQHHPSPQERIPREYTSQHPLPTYPQRTVSVQSSVPQPKSYIFASNSNSPNTPSVQPRDRRYLDISTPPSSGSSRLAEARQRREASQRLTGRLSSGPRAGLLNIRTGAVDIGRGP